jgi:signal transduction histidine kinase
MELLKKLAKQVFEITVLYVEDEQEVRKEISDILSLIFPKTIVASNGKEALQYYNDEANNIDILLTDVRMPVVDGIELITHIRNEDINLPVIVISAYSELDYFLKTIKLGIDGYILKPIELETFLVTLKKAIDKIELKKENEGYKEFLENKVKNEIDKRVYQEKILVQQSKLAAMGEMIDAIAHQWKQPLNILSMNADMLKFDYEDSNIDESYIKKYSDNFQKQMLHMLNTLEQFRSFFRPHTNAREFYVSEAIDSIKLLVKDEFMKNRIEIESKIKVPMILKGNSNEFIHLILNIINNSKDAFNENDVQERKIDIISKRDRDYICLEITDNAGGIPDHVLDDIFKPNVTTKAIGKGTGIGLYISSQIAKKFHGKLFAQNVHNGAKFTFQKSRHID